MNSAKIVGDFFLSMWIWHITFDLIHPFITAFIMFCLLRFVMKRKRLRSLAIVIGAQCAVLLALYGIVAGLLINVLGWQYEPMAAKAAIGMMLIFKPSMMLGAVYIVIQSIYFAIGRIFWDYNLLSYLVLVIMSNTLGALISFLIIRFIELSYYIG